MKHITPLPLYRRPCSLYVPPNLLSSPVHSGKQHDLAARDPSCPDDSFNAERVELVVRTVIVDKESVERLKRASAPCREHLHYYLYRNGAAVVNGRVRFELVGYL
jgi:hypothetical protein